MDDQYLDRSASLVKLADALCKAQAVMPKPAKNKVNPHFKADYADLASDWDACRKPLSDNGLCITQTMKMQEPRLILRTTLIHVSGEWLSSDYPIIPTKPDPQGYKSAVTYARRVALEALIGLTPDDDDDGNSASIAPGDPKMAPKTNLIIDKTMISKPGTPLQEVIARVGAKRPDLATPKDFEGQPATQPQIKRLFAMIKEAGLTEADLKREMFDNFKKESTKELTKGEIQRLFAMLEAEIAYNRSSRPEDDPFPFERQPGE